VFLSSPRTMDIIQALKGRLSAAPKFDSFELPKEEMNFSEESSLRGKTEEFNKKKLFLARCGLEEHCKACPQVKLLTEEL
jgi:hypothetical protein